MPNEQESLKPPPFEAANTIELLSRKDGKITHVSVYPSRAEVTRLFRFPVKVGQNQVIISGLPDVLDDDTLRVEGSGTAVIQDVALSQAAVTTTSIDSDRLRELLREKKYKTYAIKRTEKAINALSTYLSTLNVGTVSPGDLQPTLHHYKEVATELDVTLIDQNEDLDRLLQDIAGITQSSYSPKHPSMTATVGIFGGVEGEVELVLRYAVTHAGWTPVYDLRVNTDTKEKNIRLVYKASITQTTGEAWDSAPLTLETSFPSFNANVPTLYPWKLSFLRPRPPIMPAVQACMMPSQPQMVLMGSRRSRSRSRSRSPRRRSWSPCHVTSSEPTPMRRTAAAVHNGFDNAAAIATFEVPGLKIIPSDDTVHKVTIAELELDGELNWVSVPKKDVKMHLTAMIHNASDYLLLAGMSSIYINGSFTGRYTIPYASPQERFSCPLGVDPSIKVVYHSREKKRSQTGFYSKLNNHIFTQRISLMNTKSCAVTNVKIVDHIPVSEESTISVKLLSPALSLPAPASDKKIPDMAKSVQVAKGVVARWEKDDNEVVDAEKLGSDGKLSWICSIPAKGNVNLVLSWEISAPLDKAIEGL